MGNILSFRHLRDDFHSGKHHLHATTSSCPPPPLFPLIHDPPSPLLSCHCAGLLCDCHGGIRESAHVDIPIRPRCRAARRASRLRRHCDVRTKQTLMKTVTLAFVMSFTEACYKAPDSHNTRCLHLEIGVWVAVMATSVPSPPFPLPPPAAAQPGVKLGVTQALEKHSLRQHTLWFHQHSVVFLAVYRRKGNGTRCVEAASKRMTMETVLLASSFVFIFSFSCGAPTM